MAGTACRAPKGKNDRASGVDSTNCIHEGGAEKMGNLVRRIVRLVGVAGALCLAASAGIGGGTTSAKAANATERAQATASAQDDVAHLKDIVPPASHPMVEVGYHMVNLWFAAQKGNWPLANYYLGETRNRMKWEVKLNPGPKGSDGKPIDMESTFDGIDKGSLTAVKDTIAKKNAKEFVAQYKNLLVDCYSCHKNAGRPYLRPMVPTAPGQSIINPDPAATWPQ
jgi:hypothetical protein